MRVVIVTHAYPRFAGDVAGSFLGRLAEALVQRGHTLAVVAPSDGGRAQRFTLDGVDVVQVRYAAPERENLAYVGDMAVKGKTAGGLRAFWSLVRALEDGARAEAARIDAQVIHACWWIPSGWAATRLGRGVPTVISLLGTDVALLEGLPARLLGHRVLGRAQGVTALTAYLAGETRRRAFRRGLDVTVVPMPADTARFTRASVGGGGIAYLGRLTAQKRVDLLLEAVHRAKLTAPVTIVGDGPARGELEQLASRLGLSTVRFLGAISDEAVPRAIGNADVSAFLARNEGLGLAAAEAQMMGIPVVATEDGGGVLDLVQDGAGGRVVPPTPEAIGAALHSLLGNETARAAARRAGDDLRQRLSPATVAQSFEQVYARVA